MNFLEWVYVYNIVLKILRKYKYINRFVCLCIKICVIWNRDMKMNVIKVFFF